MKKFNEKSKKLKPILFIILLLSISLVGITLAYFKTSEEYFNKFKVRAYNISLNEVGFTGDFGTKKVSIENKDEAEVILRISVNELWSKKVDNEKLIISNEIWDDTKKSYENVVNKEWTNNWDNFINGGDGWYYYTKILKGNSSIPILNSISLKEDLIKQTNEYEYYKTYDYDLTFNFEAVQATSSAVKKSWNKTVIINEDNLSWNF